MEELYTVFSQFLPPILLIVLSGIFFFLCAINPHYITAVFASGFIYSLKKFKIVSLPLLTSYYCPTAFIYFTALFSVFWLMIFYICSSTLLSLEPFNLLITIILVSLFGRPRIELRVWCKHPATELYSQTHCSHCMCCFLCACVCKLMVTFWVFCEREYVKY